MQTRFAHLGTFSDLVSVAHKHGRLFPIARPGPRTRNALRKILAFEPYPPRPRQIRIERQWERDGIAGQLITWSVGYGPRTEAWLLRPAGARQRLPGVVALHDHGGFKFLGKEKIATGPTARSKLQRDWMKRAYGGRAFADELARLGFCVLVPDVFTWGSRKFPLADMPQADRQYGSAVHRMMPMQSNPPARMPSAISRYCWSAVFHEHTVQKYCHVLGTTMAGIIAFEDRVAVEFLTRHSGVQPGGVGCIGLSGGGLRAALLQATSSSIRAAVVVGLMSTYHGLLDHNVVSHTWMLYPSPALPRQADWADVAACRAPSPLMVQYNRQDALFTLPGMKAAHRRIAGHYKSADAAGNYVGEFHNGPHKFDVPMQKSAFDWLRRTLATT